MRKNKSICWSPTILFRIITFITSIINYIHVPIGTMYAIYGNIYHSYTPNVSIYTSTMDSMGLGKFHEIPCLSLFLSTGRQQRLPGYGAGCSACERGGQWLRALELADALEREVSRWGLGKGCSQDGALNGRSLLVYKPYNRIRL